MDGLGSPSYALGAAAAILLSCPNDASAYIGPGAGLELVSGFTLPLLAFIVTTLSAMFTWPIYAVARRIRGSKGAAIGPPAEVKEPVPLNSK